MPTFTIDQNITQEIAEAFTRQNHVAYDTSFQGQYYAADTDGDNVLDAVYFRGTNDLNPWHDNAVVVPVADCFAYEGNDFTWGHVEEDAEVEEEIAVDFALMNMIEVVEVE